MRRIATMGVLLTLTTPAFGDPGERVVPAPGRASTVGTAHPIRVIQTATAARWAAVCQTRAISVEEARHVQRGSRRVVDAMVPYLVRGSGAGQRIDEWVAATRDDRWLVFLRDGALILLDDVGGRERTLVAPPVPALRDRSHRIVAFDAESRYLAYLRTERTIVIRDLSSSQERTITIPGEAIARIVPEPVGSWARVLLRREGKDDAERRYEPPYPPREVVLSEDTVASGPAPISSTSPTLPGAAVPNGGAVLSPCFARAATWHYGLEGAQRWLNLATGELRDEPDVQARLGDITIRRTPQGALTSNGAVLVPARCAAVVRTVSVAPLRLVAACVAIRGKRTVEMFGPDGFHARFNEIEPDDPRLTQRPLFVQDAHVCVRQHCLRLADGHVIPRVTRTPPPRRLDPAEPGPALESWDIGPLRWVTPP